MTSTRGMIILVVCFGIVSVTASIFIYKHYQVINKPPVVGSETIISCSSTDHKIIVDATGNNKFVTNIIRANNLNSKTSYVWTQSAAKDVISLLNTSLPQQGWQVDSDWGHVGPTAVIVSTWSKLGIKLTILLFDDLDQVGIDGLSKNYGIIGPISTSTLCVMHVTQQ